MHKNEKITSILQKFDYIHPLINSPNIPPNLILAPSVASCLKLDLQRVLTISENKQNFSI